MSTKYSVEQVQRTTVRPRQQSLTSGMVGGSDHNFAAPERYEVQVPNVHIRYAMELFDKIRFHRSNGLDKTR